MNLLRIFKKPIESVSDEITTKFRTPFITTYVFVWLIRNNLFIYDLLFNPTIKDKTELLKSQFNIYEWSFYWQTIVNVLCALSLLILFYFILNISRVVTILSEERIKLNILNRLQSRTISSKDEVEFWKQREAKLNKENYQLQEELNLIRRTNDMIKKDLDDKIKLISEYEEGRELLRKNVNLLLTAKIYNNEQSLKSIIDVSNFKETIDAHFNKLDSIGKPPSFLRLQ